jgi:hypothetical protein
MAEEEFNFSEDEAHVEELASVLPFHFVEVAEVILRVAEDDWEMCEGDQLTIQGMMTSRYLAHFEAEVTAWRGALAAVSEVVTQLTEIQRKWAYLAALFLSSDEVRRELPEDAKRFEGLDASVKTFLKEMHATSNVKAACNKAGLVAQLEAALKGLDLCEKSLADFLAGKQRQFPRFYFVSKSDLLDILSNGSTPKKILMHITKVFLQTDTLMLEGGDDGGRPRAGAGKSGVGGEDVRFGLQEDEAPPCADFAQAGQRGVEVAAIELVVAGDHDHRHRPAGKQVQATVAGINVAGQHQQVGAGCRLRAEILGLEVQIRQQLDAHPGPRYSMALTMSSMTFLASPKTIIVRSM